MKKLFDKVLKGAQNNSHLQQFSQRFQQPETLKQQSKMGGLNNKIKGKMVIQHHQKLQIINQIEKLTFQDQFTPIKPELRDACEIVHYAVTHDTAVDTKHIYTILPDINLHYSSQQKQEYNEYMKYKHNLQGYQERTIEVEDVNGQQDKNSPGGRGKLSQDQWKQGNTSSQGDDFNVFSHKK